MSDIAYVSRAPDVAARMIGGELMIMSSRTSSLFSLNETAAALWQAADGVTPLARIVEREICGSFEVDAATALRDTEELARQLAEHGILRVSDMPLPDAGGAGTPA